MSAALVVGADGLIGSALLRELRGRGWTALGTTRRRHGPSDLLYLDLTDPLPDLSSRPGYGPLLALPDPAVFLAAASTGYVRCENDPEGSRRVNVTNSILLAKQWIGLGGFVVYPSSNAVFGDGAGGFAEYSARAPGSEYGRQKAAAEQALLQLAAEAGRRGGVGVVRMTKVVHAGGLVAEWSSALKSGRPVDAAVDLRLSPVSLGHVVGGMIRVAGGRRTGIYHLSGERELSYFEFAQRLAEALGQARSQVREARVRGRIGKALSNSGALMMTEASRLAGLEPQTVDSVLDALVKELSEAC